MQRPGVVKNGGRFVEVGRRELWRTPLTVSARLFAKKAIIVNDVRKWQSRHEVRNQPALSVHCPPPCLSSSPRGAVPMWFLVFSVSALPPAATRYVRDGVGATNSKGRGATARTGTGRLGRTAPTWQTLRARVGRARAFGLSVLERARIVGRGSIGREENEGEIDMLSIHDV